MWEKHTRFFTDLPQKKQIQWIFYAILLDQMSITHAYTQVDLQLLAAAAAREDEKISNGE